MSIYNRKGGSGKSGTLREQFNYYKRQVLNRLISEYSLNEAVTGGNIEGKITTMFKNMTYQDVFKQGITRKVGHRTVRYIGEEAVRVRIASMRNRASKSYQTQTFIQNYISAMEYAGFSEDSMNTVERLLNSISADKLSVLIARNILPSIQFIYSQTKSEEEFVDEVRNAVKFGISKSELSLINERKKQLVKVNKIKADIFKW